MEVGSEIGRGLRSVVHAYGRTDAVKIPLPDVPDGWLDEELRLTDAVASAGAPVPGRRRIVRVDGRAALASERIIGPSMWQVLGTDPARADDFGRALARVQIDLARCPASLELPTQRDRIASKVHLAARRHGQELLEALAMLSDDDGPLVVCHGDLHPRNVILAADGPVLVDWFDANRGSLVGEIARTVLLLDSSSPLGSGDDDDAAARAVRVLRQSYAAAARASVEIDATQFDRWLLVHRVARLAEGFGLDRVSELRSRCLTAV